MFLLFQNPNCTGVFKGFLYFLYCYFFIIQLSSHNSQAVSILVFYKIYTAYRFAYTAFPLYTQKTADIWNFSAVFLCSVFICPVYPGIFKQVSNFFALLLLLTDRNTYRIP